MSGVQAVLGCLLDEPAPMTRPALADRCGLSRPTVFAAVERLLALGLVEGVGQSTGRPGRSPSLYRVAARAGLLGAVDVGGSNVRVAVTDPRGEILTELREATAAGGGDAIMDQVLGLLDKARAGVAAEGEVATTAVAVPGVVSNDGATVIYASNIDQPKPYDFATPLRRAMDGPVLLENNVNLAAIGERWKGVTRDLPTFAVVAVGAGIGAGIMHEGRLLRGAHGAAGEVAFLPPEGRRLLVEPAAHDEAGGLTLLKTARARRGWAGGPPTTVEEIFRRAESKEPLAGDLVEEESRRVATIVASVCAVVDPEKVVLTGGVGGNAQLIARVEELVSAMTICPPEILASALGGRASLVGAVHLARTTLREQLLGGVAE